jgi:ubiquinone biosynthesis protein UbiJ
VIPSLTDEFVKVLFSYDMDLLKDFKRLLGKVQAQTEQQLRDNKGTNLEAIRSQPGYLSIRITDAARAKVRVIGDTLVFIDMNIDHGKFYRAR